MNFGIGFGPVTGGYDRGIPPLSLSADFKLPVAAPITVGPLIALSGRRYEFSYFDGHDTSSFPPTPIYKDAKFTWTDFAIGVRGMWHFNLLRNLDTYAGLLLGYVISSSKVEPDSYPYDPDNLSYFLFGFNLGARYFFTQNIGAYFELGYSGLQVVGFGLAVKI